MSRILIVEDDPAIRCGLQDNLEFESHQVLTASAGEAGYRSLCEHAPELVILDLMLPKLSGDDLCRRVRGEGFNAPILMLSARWQEGDRVMGLDLGANDYVTKPFSLRELLGRVRALLRHERDYRQDEERLSGELKRAEEGPAGAVSARSSRSCGPRLWGNLPAPAQAQRRLLADVSGKGMSAALLGASLHAAIRANATGAGVRCGEVLAKANGLLFETTAPERYATVFYGAYDPAWRMLTYANAGHYPPMLLLKGSGIRLDSMVPPAGMFAVIPELRNGIELVSGDWLLIFSDGIPEAANENDEEFGDDGLPNALSRLGDGTSAEVCEGVANRVRNHAREQRQADDITLIAVRVLSPSSGGYGAALNFSRRSSPHTSTTGLARARTLDTLGDIT